MSFKYTDDFILNCIELNKSGLTIREIAKFTGSKAKRIGERFKDFGYKPINHAVKQIPNNELISLYSQGWSVKKLAEKFSVSRAVIADRLIQQGIQPRNRSEAMFNRMKFTTKEERKYLIAKAHEVIRDKSLNRECFKKGAITRQENIVKKFVGFGEEILQRKLSKIGFKITPQFAFDTYNIDLVINGSIAVEVKLGSPTYFTTKKFKVKTEKLINSGFGVIWINFANRDWIKNRVALRNLVTYLQEFSLNPSSIGQYRVIRCYFECSQRKDKLGHYTSVLASKKPIMLECSSNYAITS